MNSYTKTISIKSQKKPNNTFGYNSVTPIQQNLVRDQIRGALIKVKEDYGQAFDKLAEE